MIALEEKFIKIALAADNILGKGKVVDSYIGTYKNKEPEQIMGANDIISGLDDILQKLSMTNYNHNHLLIDFVNAIKSLKTVLTEQFDKSTIEYDRIIKNIYGMNLTIPSQNHLKYLQRELQLNLNDLGFTNDWPDSLKNWVEENKVSGKEYFEILKQEASLLKKLTFTNLLPRILGKEVSEELRLKSVVNFEFVNTDEQWSAYHNYFKGFRSVVKINKNKSFNKQEAFFLAAHEIFPGHHLEAIIKEYLYKENKLGLSSTINIHSSPTSLISEGIAEFGIQFLDTESSLDRRISYLTRNYVRNVRHYIACNILRNNISLAEGIDKLKTMFNESEKWATNTIMFVLKDWKYHFPSYYMGYEAVSNLYNKYGDKCLFPIYAFSSLEGIQEFLQSDV